MAAAAFAHTAAPRRTRADDIRTIPIPAARNARRMRVRTARAIDMSAHGILDEEKLINATLMNVRRRDDVFCDTFAIAAQRWRARDQFDTRWGICFAAADDRDARCDENSRGEIWSGIQCGAGGQNDMLSFWVGKSEFSPRMPGASADRCRQISFPVFAFRVCDHLAMKRSRFSAGATPKIEMVDE